MTQLPLEVYRIDMKCIRNLHNIDDRVFSVFPQVEKDVRPFLGIFLVCNEHISDLANTANDLFMEMVKI